MRIVLIDTTLNGPLIGGAQTILPLLMKGLKDHGHEVHLVTNGEADKRIAASIRESGAILHSALWEKKILAEDAALILADWINKLQPEIYLISVSPDIGWLVLPRLDPSIATLTIGHTDSRTFYHPANHYSKFLTGAIGVSKQVCRKFGTETGLQPSQIEGIPYGVETDPAAPVNEKRKSIRLVYVGRLEEHQKRISDLISIAKLLTASKIDYQLDIIGDGPEQEAVLTGLATQINDNKVKFWGWLNKDAVIKLLRQSDIFLLTSAYEGFCIALVEAMANGCCPLVTDIESGNKELVMDGWNGFILALGDVEGFTEKIIALKNDPDQLYHLRQQAWQTGKAYSLERMVGSYEQYFKKASLIAKEKPRQAEPGFPLMSGTISPYPRWMRRLKKKVLGK